MHVHNMNTKKKQSELIFTSFFLHSLKYFVFFLPISNLANTEAFPVAQNRLSKDINRVKRKTIMQNSFQ